MTISIHPSWTRNYHPGDTDPLIPLAFRHPLAVWAQQAVRQSTKDKINILDNELQVQSSLMRQGGRKTWWDTGGFEEVVPIGVQYQCHSQYGSPGTLRIQDCEDASFQFAKSGQTPAITPSSPLYFRSGNCVFKAIVSSGSVTLPWNGLRGGVDTLLSRCLTRDRAPLTGGRLIPFDGPGPSTGFSWPSGLVVLMGRTGLVQPAIDDTNATAVTNTSSSSSSSSSTATATGVVESSATIHPVVIEDAVGTS